MESEGSDVWMKKFLLVCLLGCLALYGAACANPKAPPADLEPPAAPAVEDVEPLLDYPVKDGHYILADEQMGLSFGIPIRKLEEYTIFYAKSVPRENQADTPPLDGIDVLYYPPGLLQEALDTLQNDSSQQTFDEVADALNTRSRLLYSIQFYSAGLWDMWIAAGKNIADITGNPVNEELGRQGGRVYVYTEPSPTLLGITDDDLEGYSQTLAAIPGMRAQAGIIGVAPPPDRNVFPAFSAADIYGEPVDNSIFAACELTMLNVWGTFCGPCIMEMPDLGEMAAAMPEGTQLVGLVGDALNAEYIALAQSIAEDAQAAFTHVVPDKALYDFLNREIVAYPTTLFIDSRGNIVGAPVIGALNRALYEEELANRLKMLQ
jgi:thiol-disulfide isomerase/thioredoxin